MKKIVITLGLALCIFAAIAQAPQKFNYQGVARNNAGNPLANQNVSLRLSVLDNSSTGTVQYAETHTITTNAYGLFNVAVGGGNASTGSFNAITWAGGDKYLKVEIDPAGGTAFVLAGSSQLLSVPYALNAANPGPAGATGAAGAQGPAGPANTLNIGTVTNGVSASATVTGTAPNQTLNLVLPAGPQGTPGIQGAAGATGPANTLTIGSVTNGANASATITGTAPNQTLNLVLPAGPQGAQGVQGPQGLAGPAGATGATGAQGATGSQGPVGVAGPANALSIGSVTNGANASATITGSAPNQTLNLILPQGAAGATGTTGATGPQGPAGAAGPANTLTIGTVTNGANAGATLTGTAPNQTLNLVLPAGPQGAVGPQGSAGAQGAQGPAGPAGPQGPIGATGAQGLPGSSGSYTAGTGINIAGSVINNSGDLSTTNEIQSLSLAGNTLSISSGNSVTLPTGGTTYTAGTGITITSGTIAAVDPSITNEIQSLSLSGNTLSISGGNSVTLPASGGGVTGSGTTNFVPKFTSASAIGNSQIQDNGTRVFMGTLGTGITGRLSVGTGTVAASDTIPAIMGRANTSTAAIRGAVVAEYDTTFFGVALRGNGLRAPKAGGFSSLDIAVAGIGAGIAIEGFGLGDNDAAIGVLGNTQDTVNGVGIFGSALGAQFGTAGVFDGDVVVTGNLAKGGGTFKIDHPLDPENKYLYHSFVESPDMMNIYNGNIVTDAKGNATVTMPNYFNALNKDFRYQLTAIGTFAQAIIAEELSGNTFKIKTDKPNVKVSWMVTGVRQDAYANVHRVKVEVEKNAKEKGKFIHARENGQPASKGLYYDLIKKASTLSETPVKRNR